MKKVIAVSMLVFCGVALAQDPAVIDAGSLPLPESWKANAIVVLCVNFLLGLSALLVKMIPGKIGDIVAKILDVLSANVAHKK